MNNFSLRRWLRQWIHWQNLNENQLGEIKGSIFWHGRAWLHRKWKENTNHRNNIALCWVVWTHFLGAELRLCDGDSERDITLFFGCGIFAVWLTFEGAVPRWFKNRIQYGSSLRGRIIETIGAVRHRQFQDGLDRAAYQYGVLIDPVLDALVFADRSLTRVQYDAELKRLFDDGIIQMRTNDREYRINTVYEKTTDYWSREIGVSFHSGTIWLSLWKPDGHWSSTEPKWWSFSLDLVDLTLGRSKYSKRIIATHDATVPMPEANYPAKVTIEEATWRRPRWPFKSTHLSALIEVESGVPIPGKGENDWDCGEDAIFATGSSDPTVPGAVAALVKSALETRERYGGRNWQPQRTTI